MRINPREKIMLMLLILVVVCYVAFDQIIEKQMTTLSDQDIELRLQKAELGRLQSLIQDEEIIDGQIKEAYAAIQEVAKGYFNTTPQEEFILLLNDFLSMPFIDASSISFSEPQEVEIGGITFIKDSISLSLSGQYPSLVNMLKTMWAFPKKTDIISLDVSSAGFDEVSASLSLDFYTFAAESDLVDNLYEWYQDDLFYKENPFLPIEDNGVVIRYLYLPDDELFNYTKYFEFTDLESHYMEREIYEFIDYGYLYMNPYLEFGPDEPISRGEFIVLLDNVYKWPKVYDDQVDITDFRDYDDLGSLESSFAKAIHKGYLSGYVEGYSDNTLRPRDSISYQEVEFLMARIKGLETFSWDTVAASITSNKRVNESRWADKKAYMTRAEAVYLLYYFK